jgi:hypothetical protein
MAASIAPHPGRTALVSQVDALDGMLASSGGEIDGVRSEAAIVLMRMVRELLGNGCEPLDGDAISLLRVAEVCLRGGPGERLDPAGIRAALALIAKSVGAPEGACSESPRPDTEAAPPWGTLGLIAEIASGESSSAAGALRFRSRSAETRATSVTDVGGSEPPP